MRRFESATDSYLESAKRLADRKITDYPINCGKVSLETLKQTAKDVEDEQLYRIMDIEEQIGEDIKRLYKLLNIS